MNTKKATVILFMAVVTLIMWSESARSKALRDIKDGWYQETVYEHGMVYGGSMCIDGNGDLLFYDPGLERITKLDATKAFSVFSDLSFLNDSIRCLIYQPASDRVVFTTGQGDFYVQTAEGFEKASGVSINADQLAVDPADDSFYGITQTSVTKYTKDGIVTETVTSGIQGGNELIYIPQDGMLYYSSAEAGKIFSLDPSTGESVELEQGVGIPGTYEPIALGCDDKGKLYYFTVVQGLYRWESGGFIKIMDSASGAGKIVWSPIFEAFLCANGVGANIISYDPVAEDSAFLTKYINTLAVVETAAGTILIAKDQGLYSVDESGVKPFITTLPSACEVLERDGAGNIYAGLNNGVIITINMDGTTQEWLKNPTEGPVASISYDATDQSLIVIHTQHGFSTAEIRRVPIADPEANTLMTTMENVEVRPGQPTATVDDAGNIYIMERNANAIYRIVQGTNTPVKWAQNVLDSDAISHPRMEYSPTDKALIVAKINDYDAWSTSDATMHFFAENNSGVDNFGINQSLNSGLVMVHSGRVFRVKPTDVLITLSEGDVGQQIHPLLGVNAGPYPESAPDPGKDLTEEYQEFGITSVRTHDYYGPLDMAEMYPERTADPGLESSFTFIESDKRFKALMDGGFTPYFRLGDSWSNVNPPSPDELANWVQAAVNVLRHYKEGQWNGFMSDFSYVEIWNEPDLKKFWPEPLTMNYFHQLYTSTALALHSALPNLKIGGPAFTMMNRDEEKMQMLRDFLDAVKTTGAPLDFLSFHMYTNDPGDYSAAMTDLQSILNEKGFKSTKLHCTEYNTSVRTAPAEEAADLRTNGLGAALNTAGWINMQHAGVDRAYFYRGNEFDREGLPNGLFTVSEGEPNTMAHAFRLWSEICRYTNMMETSVQERAGSNSLTILAGTDNSGNTALLLANPTDAAVVYDIVESKDTKKGENSSGYTLMEVGDSADGTSVSIPTGDAFSIPPRSVHLVTQGETSAEPGQTDIAAWYYSPDEPGSGISLALMKDIIFMVWYAYEPVTGEPVWYASWAAMVTETEYQGGLRSYSDDGTDYTDLGPVMLRFDTSETMTLEWTLQGIGTGKEVFKPYMPSLVEGDADPRMLDGWWVDAKYPGQGFFLQTKGDTLYAGWYEYRDDGSPRWRTLGGWLDVGGFPAGSKSYSAKLQEYSGGQSIGGEYAVPLRESGEKAFLTFVQSEKDTSIFFTYNDQTYSLERYDFSQIPK